MNLENVENVPLEIWADGYKLQAGVGLRLYLCLKHSMMVALQPHFPEA